MDNKPSQYLLQDNLVGIANQIHLLRRLEKFEAANITLESVMAATASLPRHRERQKIGTVLIILKLSVLLIWLLSTGY